MNPIQQYMAEQDRPRWWCLQSKVNGKLITEAMIVHENEPHVDFVGAVQIYWDRDEAEAAAAEKRETFPSWLIEVIPLPPRPPLVTSQKPRENATIVAVQTVLSLGDHCVQVEIRPTTGTTGTHLMQLLGNALRIVAQNEPMARMAPVTFIRLGPCSKQAESIDKVA